jgi:hypothetical protein
MSQIYADVFLEVVASLSDSRSRWGGQWRGRETGHNKTSILPPTTVIAKEPPATAAISYG